MKDLILFIFVFLFSTLINKFVNGFLFDNLKKFSDIIQTKEKPRIIFINENNKVLAGETIFVSCISTGNPLPEIQWYINKKVISQTTGNSIAGIQSGYFSINFKDNKRTRSTLILQNVILEDSNKMLTCESENAMGTDTQSTQFIVYDQNNSGLFPSISLEDNSQSKLKRINSKIRLQCKYKNARNAKVYWYRNYEYINGPEYDVIQEKDLSKLIIRNIQHKDEGEYKCLVVNHIGGQLSKPIIIKISDIPPPTGNVTTTEIYSTSAKICWKVPYNVSFIEEFIINYENDHQSLAISIPNDKSFLKSGGKKCHLLNNLRPFMSYKVWVVSGNSLGKSETGKYAKFFTLEDLPSGPPKSITASAISNTAVEVRWKPVEQINGVLQKYILLYTEHPDLAHQHWRHYNTKTEFSLISHLNSNKVYHITIQAVNNVGKGPLSKSVAILTKSGTISECPEFRATYVLLKYIKLEWEDPDPDKSQNTLGLKLEINIPSQFIENATINLNVNQYSYEIENIKEDVEIIFTLRAFNQVGLGMPVKLTIMSAGKAKDNKNVIEISERTSFTIFSRWRRPNKEASNLTLQLFIITGKSNLLIRSNALKIIKPDLLIDQWNNFNFTRLYPNQKYRIRLTFHYQENPKTVRESFYLSGVIETRKTQPEGVGFFNVNVKRNKRNLPEIDTEWEELPNIENTSSPTVYHVRYRITSPTELSTEFQSIITNMTFYTFHFKDKPMYGVTYELTLSRYGYYNEKLETKKFVKMPEDKPTKAPSGVKIINMTKTSCTVSWNSPPIRFTNGRIVIYEVELYSINHDKTFKNLNTTTKVISFNKLQQRLYKVRVRAYTMIGSGPWSKYLEFTIYDVDINPPKDIKAYRIMDSKIKVEWKIGSDQNSNPYIFSENLFGFVLYYGTKDTLEVTSAWKQIKIFENIKSYEISNISNNDFYIVRMSSIDQYYRVGKWSVSSIPENVDLSISSIKTFTNLKCHLITINSIEIRADYPHDTKNLKQVLIQYSGRAIYWSPDNPQRVEFISEKELSFYYIFKEQIFKFVLKELFANTKYHIQINPIYTVNSKFESNVTLSSSIDCETKISAPQQVLSPKIFNKTDYSVTLRLNRTEERFGRIDNYHLLIVPYKSKANTIFKEYDKSSNDFSLIELSANKKKNSNVQPFIAFTKTTEELFDKNSFSDYTIDSKLKKEDKNLLHDGNFYRSSLRACTQTEEGQSHCTTSPWSEMFFIFFNQPEGPVSQTRKIEKSTTKARFNEQGIITLSITLSGIILALVGIVIGCIVHKRKASNKKWENPGRSSAPEILQDAQMTPLVDINVPKLDQEIHMLRTDQNYAFDSNNDVINFKGYMINNTILKNHFDSPIQLKSKPFLNNPDAAPDIVNVCDGFNFYNHDIPQLSLNMSSKYVIPIGKLSEYVGALKNYDSLKLMQEFEDLNKETFDKYASINSNLARNKLKNRYANVIAYDHSLVVLQNQLDRESGNYINANYIDGYGKQNEYIATQGPLSETINDFWQMIWEQKTSIIVMLIKIEDSESKKCEVYWPKKGTRIYLDMEVTLMSTINRAYYIIRKFQVKQNGFSTKRQVYHLQFTGWPDQGIPILCAPFISFIKIYRNFNKLDCGPTVVHCSAGVGRTGVFIAVDSQMERIRHEKSVNLYEEIKNMRKNRNYMVQTEAQYGFIYDVLLEWSLDNTSDINPDMLISHIKTKSQIVECQTLTGFEVEFQRLNLQSSNITANMSKIYGSSTVNKQKNNSPHLIPFDWNRVTLSSISGVDGSDYINASFVDSYSMTKAYIVSQDPIASTVEDFWRLVWDKNCSIIVVLGKIEEFVKDLSLPYWPVQKSIRYQFFVVDPMVEYNMSNYIMREFKVTDARDGEYRTIRQFHYSKWQNNICPCDAHSFLEFIHQVQITKDNFGLGNPILVHCSYGTGKSGIFIAINNILEKLKHESLIDVYGIVKLLQQQRIGLVQTVDQYKFCYLSILTHLIDVNPELKAQFCGFKEYISVKNNN